MGEKPHPLLQQYLSFKLEKPIKNTEKYHQNSDIARVGGNASVCKNPRAKIQFSMEKVVSLLPFYQFSFPVSTSAIRFSGSVCKAGLILATYKVKKQQIFSMYEHSDLL